MQAAPRHRIRSEQSSELAGDREIQREIGSPKLNSQENGCIYQARGFPNVSEAGNRYFIFSDFGFLLTFNLSIVWIWKWNHRNILTENILIIIAAPFYRILGCYTCAVKEYIFSSQWALFSCNSKIWLASLICYMHVYIFFICLRLRIC